MLGGKVLPMFIKVCDCCQKRITGKGITVTSEAKPLHFCDQHCEVAYFDNRDSSPDLTDEEALWRMGLPPLGSKPGGRR